MLASGRALEPLEHEAVLAGQRHEDRERTSSPGVRGRRLVVALQTAAIRAGMSPGAQQRLVVRVEQRHVARARAAASAASSP